MGSPVSSTFLGGLGSAATRILRVSSVRGVFVVTFPSHRFVSAVDLPGKNRLRHIFPQEVEPYGGRVPYPPGDREVQPVRFFASAAALEFRHGQRGLVRAPGTGFSRSHHHPGADQARQEKKHQLGPVTRHSSPLTSLDSATSFCAFSILSRIGKARSAGPFSASRRSSAPTYQASPFSKNTCARSFRPSSNIAISLSFSPFGLCEPSIDLPNSRKRSPDIWEALMAISIGDFSLDFSK